MTDARMRIFPAVWAVASLAFAVFIGIITGGTASAVMALIGAALVGAVIYLVTRAVFPAKPKDDVSRSA